ncbi:MAG: 3-dehydroquinate synthase [Gemmatimonadota bacterium]
MTHTIDAGAYRVHIGAGLRHSFAHTITDVAAAHRYAVITDDHVAPLYADDIVSNLSGHGRVSLHIVPEGEAHKTRDSWARLTDEMLEAGHARDTTVVAVGGGVVGDLAGFVAATFMRGIPVVQCPTSLLAMIDASVGGKTGVDTAAGKNLVGAFHEPAAVLVDVEMIATLSLPQRRSGLAEAIKHGAIADERYFRDIDTTLEALQSADADATLDLVSRSVQIKADVVRGDAREQGKRKILNFGHTLGHAIEHACGYSLLHGECVAIGMVLEATLAERLGVAVEGTATELERVLRRASLPIRRPSSLAPAAVLDATRLDKKARAGSVEYALPTRIGAMAAQEAGWAMRVDDAVVLELLTDL